MLLLTQLAQGPLWKSSYPQSFKGPERMLARTLDNLPYFHFLPPFPAAPLLRDQIHSGIHPLGKLTLHSAQDQNLNGSTAFSFNDKFRGCMWPMLPGVRGMISWLSGWFWFRLACNLQFQVFRWSYFWFITLTDEEASLDARSQSPWECTGSASLSSDVVVLVSCITGRLLFWFQSGFLTLVSWLVS